MLHDFLEASFPSAYKERAEEARQEEEESDVASPQHVCSDHHCVQSKPMDEGGPSSDDFACNACGKLVYKPFILNCGHVVCMHHVDANQGCPICHAAFHGGETLCTQLWDWMTRMFPVQCEERRQELCQSPEDRMHLAKERHQKVEEAATQPDTEEMPTSSGRMDDDDYPEDFTHFGVGCDICGEYPIIGKRYKCLDCPESVGFDVCRPCLSSCTKGTTGSVGRFNQKHRSDHRLELVPPLMTKLHTIKELHPDLDYNRLLSLIEMAWEDHSANLPPPQEQQQQQQDDDDDDDEPMADGSTMMRPRGPRPRHDQE